MALKPPQRPEDIYGQITDDLKAALGPDLLGLCVFGSAAQGRYVQGVSDVNLLVLMSDGSHHRLKDLIPFCRKWAPAKVATPLVLTPGFARASQDVFPIEFLVMAAGHRPLFGQDPLAGLRPDPEKLRLQLERELRAKLMAIRSRLLRGGGQESALLDLAREALSAFTALFQALLHLTTGSFPLEPHQVMAAMVERGLGGKPFQGLARQAGSEKRAAAGEMMALWENALADLESIIATVDQLEQSKEPGA